ncbi:anthrax toxin lethal factor-related metalloendopeptidase [Spirillospora sp. CA-128828]|uniref:anthrax toxin lethal factor-related metalloendopeptidase n=1 Tax=Spirillospora sp. CA-128828 TaxID=3240033 RepID=UPI003D8AC54D
MNEPEVPPLSPNVHPVPSNGRRHTGPIEAVLHRCWPRDTVPPAQLVTAVDRLATLPSHLAGRLVGEITGIYIGLGMVTDYPAFADLYDHPVDPSRPDGPRWQHIPAGYRNRVIVIGSGGTPLTRDLTMHEVAHALDDMDGMISDAAEFRALHWTCREALIDDRYVRQRQEFFAEAFTLCYLRVWDVLEAWLGGATSRAFDVASWYRRNYDVGR